MSDELPNGWALTRLEDLTPDPTAITYGVLKPGPVDDAGVPMLRVMDIRNGRVGDSGLYRISKELARQYQRTRLRGGEVLISVQGSVGRVAIVPSSLAGANISRTLAVIPPVKPELAGWIWAALQTPQVQSQMDEVVGGTTRDSLNLRDLRVLQIPLPPPAEQRRIVAKLETLLGKVDASQQRLAKVPVLLKRFRQSVLAAACSGRLTADWREENATESEAGESIAVPDHFPTLPETWHWQSLEAVCEKIADCPHSTPKWTGAGRLCARTTNFKPGFLDLSEVRYVSDATFNERIERLRPKPGDVLYSREGGILGIACMIPPKVELCLGQRMMLFRTKADFSAALLMHWLNSRVILRRVQELTGGSASPHLNVRDIKAFPTPIAPLPEQQEIVRRVEGLFALADQLEVRLAKARVQVDALTPSVLALAFAGKLVPQNANDEPAEELLARIKNRT